MKVIKESINEFKRFRQQGRKLQTGLHRLMASQANIASFTRSVRRAATKWQFKNRPHFEQIQDIIKKITKNRPN